MKYLCFLLFLLTTGSYASSVKVQDAWARPAKTGASTAIYLTLKNTSNTQKQLLGARSSVSSCAQIRKSVVDKNISHTLTVSRLVLPANKVIEFKTNGLYILLRSLKHDLKHGDVFDLQLIFSDFNQSIKVVVR